MDAAYVASRKNPLVARLRAAADGGPGTPLLLVGVHLIGEALDGGLHIEHALVAADAPPHSEAGRLADRLAAGGVPLTMGSASVMSAASPLRSPAPLVALAARPKPDPLAIYRGGVPLLVFACGIQDPGNLGAIIRTAEAAGATGLVTMSAGADPYGWKALRGSMGSALRLPIVVATDVVQAIEDAKMHGCRLMGAVPRGGACYRDTDFSQPTAIAVGGEGQGLSDEVLGALDQRVSVPMAPPVESLNTAVTAALLLFEAARQRAR